MMLTVMWKRDKLLKTSKSLLYSQQYSSEVTVNV